MRGEYAGQGWGPGLSRATVGSGEELGAGMGYQGQCYGRGQGWGSPPGWCQAQGSVPRGVSVGAWEQEDGASLTHVQQLNARRSAQALTLRQRRQPARTATASGCLGLVMCSRRRPWSLPGRPVLQAQKQ